MYRVPLEHHGQAENDQKITSSGGAAINLAVFVQNVQQLRRLLTPTLCNTLYKEQEANKNIVLTQLSKLLNDQLGTQLNVTGLNFTELVTPTECDEFEERSSVEKVPFILLCISISLQLGVGLLQHGEALIFRLTGAEVYEPDIEDEVSQNEQNEKALKKRLIIRTLTAVAAFIIAILTMIIGAFEES